LRVCSGVLGESRATAGACSPGEARTTTDRLTGAHSERWASEPSRRGAPGVNAGLTGTGSAAAPAGRVAGCGADEPSDAPLTTTAATPAAAVTAAAAAPRGGISR
jgi:hypothetical protein